MHRLSDKTRRELVPSTRNVLDVDELPTNGLSFDPPLSAIVQNALDEEEELARLAVGKILDPPQA
jgi:hypothetical protein